MAEEYKGTVDYFQLLEEKHTGPHSDSKQIPIVAIGIRDEQGLHEVKLPIDIPYNPFSARLIENDLWEQEVLYCHEIKNTVKSSGPIWSLEVISGRLKGVRYVLEELVDF